MGAEAMAQAIPAAAVSQVLEDGGRKGSRAVLALAASQALSSISIILMVMASPLVGLAVAPSRHWATVPLAAHHFASMLTTVPASLFMRRFGRRSGFRLGAAIGAIGAVLAAVGVAKASFLAFVCGAALIGSFNGFAGFFRFAAAEAAPAQRRARAISLVMSGGVAAAVLGPLLGRWSKNLIPGAAFIGCFLVVAAACVLAFAVLHFVQLDRSVMTGPRGQEARPLFEIVRQPKFVVAVCCGTLGYGLMALLMSATPIAMSSCGHSFKETASVIQWHVLGMFAPSFFTGRLIKRFGTTTIMLMGAALVTACASINLCGTSMVQFWSALVCLGTGWNFLYIGATTLLIETYRPAEKEKAQAFNDFGVFSSVTAASLTAGVLQEKIGWRTLNLSAFPVLVFIAMMIVALAWQQRGATIARTGAPSAG